MVAGGQDGDDDGHDAAVPDGVEEPGRPVAVELSQGGRRAERRELGVGGKELGGLVLLQQRFGEVEGLAAWEEVRRSGQSESCGKAMLPCEIGRRRNGMYQNGSR